MHAQSYNNMVVIIFSTMTVVGDGDVADAADDDDDDEGDDY